LNRFAVFIASAIASLCVLLLERLIGINWDFHPDSVTYATESSDIYRSLIEAGVQSIPNNFYYVLVHAFDQSIILVTILNVILYSFTNILIFNSLKQRYGNRKLIYIYLLIFINPYRLHLSTTLLKDTLIIFCVAWTYSSRIKFVPLLLMMITRVVSILYIIPLLVPRLFYFFMVIFFLLIFVEFSPLIEFLIKSSENEMTFRDFDSMPTFQNFGLMGSFLRGIIWAPLTFSGLFVLLSPSIMFVPVSFGIFVTLFSVYKLEGYFPISISYFALMVTFGVLVTGFTSYLRYIYPILCLYPLIMIKQK
jgi:hypothetical protein